MTALELIHLLKFMPGDTEITVDFSFNIGGTGDTIEHHKVLDISPEGILKTKCTSEDFIGYYEGEMYDEESVYAEDIDYYSPEEDLPPYLIDPNGYYEDVVKWENIEIMEEIEAAWEEHEASKIFQTAEEEEGYIEYQNTLYQQDRDLEELVTKAHKIAEEEFVNTINNELNDLLCKN